MEKWVWSVLNINATVNKLGEKCKGILHALSGCDTVSYPNGKGKVSALKVLRETEITGLDRVLGEEDATYSDLMETGKTFFLHLYSQKKSTSMNSARFDIYRKRKHPPSLKSLPPTDSNLSLHIQRAHPQMILWKAAGKPDPPALQITDYGWKVTSEGEVVPILSTESTAPENLIDVISCCCKALGNACSSIKCSCAANSVACTSYCVCEGGDDCYNLLTQHNNGEEGYEKQEEENDLENEEYGHSYEDEDGQ